MISEWWEARQPALGIAVALLLSAVLATAVVDWREGRPSGGEPSGFSSCRFEGDSLVLAWTHGSGDAVSTSIDPHPDEIVVRLDITPPSGPRIAIGLSGETRSMITGGARPVRYADGTPLDCPTT